MFTRTLKQDLFITGLNTMSKIKRHELLKGLPTYGPMYVSISDNEEPFYSEGIIIRFYKADGTNWVANFAPGWTELTEIIELNNTPNYLVIAKGTCYIMNPGKTRPVATFGADYAALYATSKERCVLVGGTHLTIVEPDGSYWHTERISWDGLKVFTVESNIVTGEAFNPTHENDNWIPFSYNIDTKTLKGGSCHAL